MTKPSSRRDFLRNSILTGSLLVLPGSVSRLTASNPNSDKAASNKNKNQFNQPVQWFSAEGETIYHLKAGKTSDNSSRSIFAAAFSGNILCFDFSGKMLWQQKCCNFFPFSMDAGDIDGDGFDECVIASADGSLYIIDHNGKLIAKVFGEKPPLYAVKIVQDHTGKKFICCGGPERVLYQISGKGEIISQIETTGTITNISSGCFNKSGKISLVVKTDANYNNVFISLYQLPEFKIQQPAINTKTTFIYNMITADVDDDGLDQIVFGGAKGGVILNETGIKINQLQEKTTGKGQEVYSMVMLDKLPSGNKFGYQMVGIYGSSLRCYGSDGKILKEVSMDISPAGFCFDEISHTLLFGSEISGGDTIYAVQMDAPGWEESLEKIGYKGKIDTIVSNIEKLTKQIDQFKAPAYQSKEITEMLCVYAVPESQRTVSGDVKNDLNPRNSFKELTKLFETEFPYPALQFAGNQWVSENWDRTALPHGWDKKRDKRLMYQLTSNEIVDYAARLENEKLSFVWTIGHGNDPFYLNLPTIEKILMVAPNACKGFIFPEVARDDTPAYQYAMTEHLKPVCELCLKYGKRKVFLRSKFLHWAADCYTKIWSWTLEDKRYKDVIVPAMEETYERLCDLSISGRVGLKMGGWFADWAGRAVHDNNCYDRQHQWGATLVGSHFLRALCYQAGMGARFHLIQLSEVSGGGGKASFRGHAFIVKPYLHMLGKGILPCPQNQQDMLSVSPVALGMKVPSEEFMQASHNSHETATYKYDPKWVFSRLQCFWGQAPTPKYDFGYYGIGRRRQALNFIPKNPYGLVPVVSSEAEISEISGINQMLVTNGEVWFDSQGSVHQPEEYASQVEMILQKGAKGMFLQVKGDVAWTATRLDKSHVRLVLIDSGYLDPADRVARIKVNASCIQVTDILGEEQIQFKRNSFKVIVPMGILRVLDIEHS